MKRFLLVGVFAFILLISTNSVQALTINADLRYGARNNSEVRALQQFLISKGYMTGTATGNFFGLTRSAVQAYQRANNIETTGFVGAQTRTAIRQAPDDGDSAGGGGTGGSTGNSTGTCSDNIKNGDETGIDIGGRCSSSNSSATASVTLKVNGKDDTDSITSGSSANLSWTATNNLSFCSLWTNGVAPDITNAAQSSNFFYTSAGTLPTGSKTISNITANTTFKLGCVLGTTGAYSNSVQVNIGTSPQAPAGAVVNSVSVTPATNSIAIGSTVQLTATAKDANAAIISGKTFVWTSGTPAVATIDQTGKVTAVAVGNSSITAVTDVNKEGKVLVTVTARTANGCPASYTGPQVTNCASTDFISSMTATCTNGVWATTTPCRVPEADLYVARPFTVQGPPTHNVNGSITNVGITDLAYESRYATSCLLNGDTVFNRVSGMTGPLFDWTGANQSITRGPGVIPVYANGRQLVANNTTLVYSCTGPGGTSASTVRFVDPYEAKDECKVISLTYHRIDPNSSTDKRLAIDWSVTSGCYGVVSGHRPSEPNATDFQDINSGESSSGTLDIGLALVDRNITLGARIHPTRQINDKKSILIPAGSAGTTAVPRTTGTTADTTLFSVPGRTATYKIVHSPATNSLLLVKVGSWSKSYRASAGSFPEMCLKIVDDNDPHRAVNPPNFSVIPYLSNVFFFPVFVSSCSAVSTTAYSALGIQGSGSNGSSSSSGGSSAGGTYGDGETNNGGTPGGAGVY